MIDFRPSRRATRSSRELEDLVEDMGSWVAGGLQGVKVGFGKKGDARLGYAHDRDVRVRRAAARGDRTGRRR